MTDVISVTGLVKTFGSSRALDGLDLTVRAGEVHGFLGPNGAGKSTTIRILLGMMKATSGTATLLGGDPWTDAPALHRRLAYVPGDVTLWPNLSGGEAIDLIGRMRGGLDQKRRAELVERFALDQRKKGRAYSTGNRQKVALVAAFASNAELLVLDEPTSGLDPLMENTFRDVVKEENDRRGCTVLLSSHILSEVEAVCDRVTIIRSGRTVDSGALDEMRQLAHILVSAELDGDPDRVAALPGVHSLTVEGRHLECTVDPKAMNGLLRELSAIGVQSLTTRPPTLEELFLRHYEVSQLAAADGRPEAGR